MDFQTEFPKIKELVDKARDILILTHEKPTFDSIGSSLSLYLGFLSLGKRVTIACPDPIMVELSSFIGVNKVVREIGKKNFIISLDYIEGSIEKVSYNIEGNAFNLVIEPRSGFPPFSSDKVHYTYGGGASDLIIAVDTIDLGGLKQLYESDKDFYTGRPLINIDRHPNNTQYGQVNFVDTQASSTAELTGRMLSALGVGLTEDIATNLLNALYGGTNNFQNTYVTAGAFSLAASCVKAGGRRFRKLVDLENRGQDVPQGLPKTGTTAHPSLVEEVSTVPVGDVGSARARSSLTPNVRQPGDQDNQDAPGQPVQAPADWLKPKIFKSSNLL